MEPTGPQHEEAIKDWWWGDLQDHMMECDECDGTGLDCPSDPESDECSYCDGEGETRWGSYYEQDRGECEHCRRGLVHGGLDVPDPMPEVGIAAMFAGNDWICLRCYVAMHQHVCRGCDLWREAEVALLGPREDQAWTG